MAWGTENISILQLYVNCSYTRILANFNDRFCGNFISVWRAHLHRLGVHKLSLALGMLQHTALQNIKSFSRVSGKSPAQEKLVDSSWEVMQTRLKPAATRSTSHDSVYVHSTPKERAQQLELRSTCVRMSTRQRVTIENRNISILVLWLALVYPTDERKKISAFILNCFSNQVKLKARSKKNVIETKRERIHNSLPSARTWERRKNFVFMHEWQAKEFSLRGEEINAKDPSEPRRARKLRNKI
jgi:hypothetical protein